MTDDHDPTDLPRTPEMIVTDLVDNLVAALVNSRIYWTNHPRVVESLKAVTGYLAEACRATAGANLTVAVASDFLVFDDRPLLGATLSAPRLIGAMHNWESGGIEMSAQAGIADFQILLESIKSARGDDQTYESVNQRLAARGHPRIKLLQSYKELENGINATPEELRGRCVVPLQIYQSAMDLLQGVTVSVSTGSTIDFAPVQTHAEMMLQRLESNEGALMNLARQDHYDAFTFGHSVRVSVLALNFGRALTNDPLTLIQLGTAALLHDVGKAMVPFESPALQQAPVPR